jgi:hypothetical protein
MKMTTVPALRLFLFLAFAGGALALSAQTKPSSRPATQTFRDSKGRITGTETTTPTPSGSSVTTYQTGSGKPVSSSTKFPEEGSGTLVHKNVYPANANSQNTFKRIEPVSSPSAKNTEEKKPAPDKQTAESK